MNCYIIRYGEIALKGKNRSFFEHALILQCKKEDPSLTYKILYGRIILFSAKNIYKKLLKIFGITSISVAKELPIDFEIIKKEILKVMKNKKGKTFRISTQRVNKLLPYTSQEVNQNLGAFVVQTCKNNVSLFSPNVDIGLELLEKAYLFFDRTQGLGGLPVGSQGKVFGIVDTPLSKAADILIMKRGCRVIPLSFKKGKKSLFFNEKVIVCKSIKEMEELARRRKIKALVVSDSLSDIKSYPTHLLILRPLVGIQTKDIKKYHNLLYV